MEAMALLVLVAVVVLLCLGYFSARFGYASTRFGYLGRGLRAKARRVEPQSPRAGIPFVFKQLVIVLFVLGVPLLVLAVAR
jgi:hypothetical protein